jgi:hypothetical protein
MRYRWLIGILLIGHGLLHLFGFLTSWDLVEIEAVSRTPTILADDLPVGVIRDIGALWLLGLFAFALSGVGVIRGYRWWKGLAFGSAAISLIATIFWIHETWPGLILNLIIIVLIARTWWHAEHPGRTSEETQHASDH